MIYLEDNNKENIRKKRLNKMFKAEEIGKKKEYFGLPTLNRIDINWW
jgi:hypothetical protein